MTEPTQFGDNVAAEMRAYFEAHKREKWVEGTADNLMLGLFNIAIRAIEATRSSVTADDALRDDAEWLRSLLVAWPPGQETEGEARLERIASRLRSPSPDGEVTEEMIEAGLDALFTYKWSSNPEQDREMLAAIFKAMISARSGG